MGKRVLKIVDKSFEYLERSLNELAIHKRFRHTAIRIMITYHSTTSRPTTEEPLLSMYVDDNDVRSPEFIRLYVSEDFYGSCLLRVLERAQMCNTGATKEEQKTLPKIQSNVEDKSIMLHHSDALYGWRPNDDEIFYLNAWEFLMWWRVVPKDGYLSRRLVTGPRKFVLEYPCDAMDLHEKYLLVRRTRPVVPAPTHTPMLDRVPQYPESPGRQHEERCRLYCVYMRPWTSNERFQTVHVPLRQLIPTATVLFLLCFVVLTSSFICILFIYVFPHFSQQG